MRPSSCFTLCFPLFLGLSASAALAQVAANDTANAIRTVPYANSNPTGYPPPDHSWSPDGKRFTYVAVDGQAGQPGDIISVDTASGQSSVLASAEKLSQLAAAAINEKDADHRSRYGMSAFLWADDSKHLLLDQGGRLYLYDIAAGTGTLVVDTGAGSGDDPKFSPDARSVSYLRNHNLYVHPVANDAGARETALTTDTVPHAAQRRGRLGSTSKNSTSVATTSGRPTPPPSPTCRWTRPKSPTTPSSTSSPPMPPSTTSATRSPATPTPASASASSPPPAARRSGSSCPSTRTTTTSPASAGSTPTPSTSRP